MQYALDFELIYHKNMILGGKNMCKIISICNQKGGVGKTTTTINLGVSLSKLGNRVLLLDLYPQGNMTDGLGYHDIFKIPLTIKDLMYDIISGNESETHIEDCILKAHGVDFIPCNLTLSTIEIAIISSMNRENCIKRILAEVKENYDYILINCPPSLSILTINALTTSDSLIIPVQSQYFAAKGLELLLDTISKVRKGTNPNLRIEGIIITMIDNRSNHQKELYHTLRENYENYIKVFSTLIPLSVKVSDNQSRGIPMIDAKDNFVAESYQNFAKELISIG